MQVVYNPLQGILSIIRLVSFWKILEDRGEKGWKSLIPFYSTYTLGKTFNDTKTAKKLNFSVLGLLVSVFVFFLAVASSYNTSTYQVDITDINDINGLIITSSDSGSLQLTPFMIVALLLMILSLIFLIVYYVKFYKHFDEANGAQSWMIILWLVVPAFAAAYFAFVHKNYDIPGVTEKTVVEKVEDHLDQQ